MRDCGVYFYCELEVKLDRAAVDLADQCLPVTWTFTLIRRCVCLAHCGQVCWDSDALCCDYRTACMNHIIRVKIPPCGLFSETLNVLQHKACEFSEIFLFFATNARPLVTVVRYSSLRLRWSAQTRPKPCVCFSPGLYCCFYLFVPLPKHCLITGSHAVFLSLSSSQNFGIILFSKFS